MSTEIVKSHQPVQSFDFFNQTQFETVQRVAMVFANSELVPDRYRISEKNPREKALANNIIALEMASRIGASPLMVMQNLYMVHGTPGWAAKFLIATVNTCGRFESIKYRIEAKGKIKFNNQDIDNLQCVAYTTAKGSDDLLESTPVDIAMAIAEGWYGKNGSKWKTMPLKMLRYRAASFWVNEFAPEISMGMKTSDELEDIIPFEDVTEKMGKEIKESANKTELSMDEAQGTAVQKENQAAEESGKAAEANPNGQTTMNGPGF